MKKLYFITLLFFIIEGLYAQDPVYIVRDTTTDYSQRRIYPAPVFTMGVIDENGETVIPFLYEDIRPLVNGQAIVKKYEKYGTIDSLGNQLIPFVFDELHSFIECRAVAYLYGKWGIVDEKGKEIVPFVFDEILHFNGNNAIVKQEGKYAVISVDQKIVSSFIYDAIEPFNEGVAVAERNGYKGILDTVGDEKGIFAYEWLYPCSGGALVAVEKGRYSIVDREGIQMVPYNYDEISSFNRHGVGIVSRERKYGIMNNRGLEIVSPAYDEMTLYDDCAAVKLDNSWGIIDFTGGIIVPLSYQSIRKFYGDLLLVRKNDRWRFYDLKTKEEIPYVFESVSSQATYKNSIFSDLQRLYSPARRDGKWGMVDSLGQIAVPFVFETERIVPLAYNVTGVWKGGRMAFADFTGKLLTEYIYDEGFTLSDKLVRVKREGKFGVVNNDGQIIHTCEYDGVYPLVKNGFCTIYKNGKYGIINNDGKEIVPLRYASIIPFTDKLFVVRR